jgi:hypothetical protein
MNGGMEDGLRAFSRNIPIETLSMLAATTRDQSAFSDQKSCVRRSARPFLKGLLCLALPLSTYEESNYYRRLWDTDCEAVVN